MSSTVDVGDAVELTFTGTTGATVTASWYDPDDETVIDAVGVAESPGGSGLFPYTFLPTSAGLWHAVFTSSGAATAVEEYWVRANAIGGPAPLATVDEVAELFRPLTAAEQSLVSALLRRASAIIRSNYPDLAARIAAGTLDSGNAALAVINMVLRVIRNPGGLRSETVGPFTRTFFDAKEATGLLTLTAAETALLNPRPTATARARTIRVEAGLAPPVCATTYTTWG